MRHSNFLITSSALQKWKQFLETETLKTLNISKITKFCTTKNVLWLKTKGIISILRQFKDILDCGKPKRTVSIKELVNLNGYKYLAITAGMNVVVVLAQPARITNQMQCLVIVVVVSITETAKDQY